MSSAFCYCNKEVVRPEWFAKYLKDGESTRTEQMRRTLAVAGIVDDERAIRLSKAYMEERNKRLRLLDDAKEVLDQLKGRYPLGLITNGPADVQREEVSTLGI